jgi:hypothetical protein
VRPDVVEFTTAPRHRHAGRVFDGHHGKSGHRRQQCMLASRALVGLGLEDVHALQESGDG